MGDNGTKGQGQVTKPTELIPFPRVQITPHNPNVGFDRPFRRPPAGRTPTLQTNCYYAMSVAEPVPHNQ